MFWFCFFVLVVLLDENVVNLFVMFQLFDGVIYIFVFYVNIYFFFSVFVYFFDLLYVIS